MRYFSVLFLHLMLSDILFYSESFLIQSRLQSSSTYLHLIDEKRREVFLSSPLLLLLPAPIVLDSSAVDTSKESATDTDAVITLPLEFIPRLNAYTISYVVFGEPFTAIVDTGSPFLTLPSYCNSRKWGCYRPERTKESGLSNTYEGFVDNQGTVVWRRAEFQLGSEQGTYTNDDIVFGVMDTKLTGGSGGVFLGLIKNTSRKVRPSFLGQTPFSSFAVDLRENKSLTLSTMPLVGDESDCIPLVSDLRKFGDPVLHYTGVAKSITVNGSSLFLNSKRGKPLPTYVIFDTGVSGMVISQGLFDERYRLARENKERNLWGRVEIEFDTSQGNSVTLQADKPLTTPLTQTKPWPKFRDANLIVVGLALLDGHKLAIDIDEQRLQID